MKRALLLLSVLLVAVLATTSCSKDKDDDDNNDDLVVKYEVLHSDARVSSINYTDATGGGGYKDFPPANWSIEIRPESKPFTATLKAIFENPDNTVVNYTLNIRVNGVVKATKDFTLHANELANTQIQYVIE